MIARMARMQIEWRNVSPYDAAYVLVDDKGRVRGAPTLTKTGARLQRRKLLSSSTSST